MSIEKEAVTLCYMKTHLEEFVETLYLKIDVLRPIKLDIELMAAEMGITVEYILDSSKGLKAGSHFIVLLNDALSSALKWQEFAHEIAHILRHSGNQYLLPYDFRVLQEWQASHFALYFCIPTFILQEIDLPFHKRLAVTQIAETFGFEYSFAEERIEPNYTRFKWWRLGMENPLLFYDMGFFEKSNAKTFFKEMAQS